MDQPIAVDCDSKQIDDDLPEQSLDMLLESLLFVAQEPVPVERLASVLSVDLDKVERALSSLAAAYSNRGMRLQRARGMIQLVSAPETAEVVRRFLGLEMQNRLSPPALETLAIVAYRQPVTRSQIEAIRGVNSDSVLRTLVTLGLIQPQGRLEQPGRPIIYGTTFEFLQQFGLSGVDHLPPLTGLSQADDLVP